MILSPADRCYLDMKYDPQTPIGHDWAGTIDVQRAYDWDPTATSTGCRPVPCWGWRCRCGPSR